jgi:hypothetical protein
MLSLVDSHSSLSQKKDKNTDRSLAHEQQISSSFHSLKKHALYLQQAAQPHTQKQQTQNKREPPQTRKSNIYQRRWKYSFTHTTTTAPINSISIYKTESVSHKL